MYMILSEGITTDYGKVIMTKYELLTADNRVIEWPGENGEDAARRCADCKRVTIVAWREPRVQLRIWAGEDA